jgi:hypothetical protein
LPLEIGWLETVQSRNLSGDVRSARTDLSLSAILAASCNSDVAADRKYVGGNRLEDEEEETFQRVSYLMERNSTLFDKVGPSYERRSAVAASVVAALQGGDRSLARSGGGDGYEIRAGYEKNLDTAGGGFRGSAMVGSGYAGARGGYEGCDSAACYKRISTGNVSYFSFPSCRYFSCEISIL